MKVVTGDGAPINVSLRAKLIPDADGGVVICGQCGEEICQLYERKFEHMRIAHGGTGIERGLMHRPGWKQDGDVWRRGSPGRWARGHRVLIDGEGDDWDLWTILPMVAECPLGDRRRRHLNVLDADTLRVGIFPSSRSER